ncbi:putative pre-rrna processing protein [Diaporthe ampelina]|uniref:Multiple RNA-binding domain-containing protein 1 n=1 Tax=Diaporthe ampelina TaxID=1214573 RepID=A0A0G2FMU2_9PEZI|nr:putative pre-rrna processing protein [Diaporthe ampelina]
MSAAGVESSRLFVKNLPPSITEADFRKHFATGGREVTDIKLISKRRIGYVGYKTPDDAAKAVKFFNRSYIRLSKISVEIARPISDPSLPTAKKTAPRVQNKLPTPEPEPRAKEADAIGKKRKREGVDESDPKLKEYLDMMRPGQTTSSKLEGIYGQQPSEQEDVEMAVVPVDAESDDEYEAIPAKKPKHQREAVEEAPAAQAPGESAVEKMDEEIATDQILRTGSAIAALHDADGKPFQGRILHILPGQPKKDHQLDDFAISQLPLKKQNLLRKKSQASTSTFNWNSLYMNQDAVLASTADRLGVSKSELLDPTSTDGAVRQAVAETQIIQETKAYFASHGVDVEAFKSQKKGDTAVLVKNFPYGTSLEELRKLQDTTSLYVKNLSFDTTTAQLADAFKPLDGFVHAQVKTKTDPKKPGQVLSMGFGFVHFRSKVQAEAAVKAMNGFVLDNHTLAVKASHKGHDAAEEKRREDKAKKAAGQRTKIVIKNLAFEASRADLRRLLGTYGKLRVVRIPKKFNSSSRGFAFAEFESPREAENCIRSLKDTHLLGRKLVLDYAEADAVDAEEEIAKMQKKIGGQVNKVELQKLTAGKGSARQKFEIGEDNEDNA